MGKTRARSHQFLKQHSLARQPIYIYTCVASLAAQWVWFARRRRFGKRGVTSSPANPASPCVASRTTFLLLLLLLFSEQSGRLMIPFALTTGGRANGSQIRFPLSAD